MLVLCSFTKGHQNQINPNGKQTKKFAHTFQREFRESRIQSGNPWQLDSFQLFASMRGNMTTQTEADHVQSPHIQFTAAVKRFDELLQQRADQFDILHRRPVPRKRTQIRPIHQYYIVGLRST